MRVTAILTAAERKRQDGSVHRAEKRRRWARMMRVCGPACPNSSVWAHASAVQSPKRLISKRNQAILTSNGRPLGECRTPDEYEQKEIHLSNEMPDRTHSTVRHVQPQGPSGHLRVGPVKKWHTVWIPVALAAFSVLLAVTSVLVLSLDWRFSGAINPAIIRFVDLNGEANLPAWFGTLLWLVAALLAFAIWQEHRVNGCGHGAYWIGMVPLFLFLSLDEAAMIHEAVGAAISERIIPTGVFAYTYAWVLFGLVFVAFVGVIYLRLLTKLRGTFARSFIFSAIVFISGAVVVESTGAAFENGMLTGMPFDQSWARMIAYEETLEMLGVILLIRTLLRILTFDAPLYREQSQRSHGI